MSTPMATAHVGETVDVWLFDLIDNETGERIDDPDYDVTVTAPSGANPTTTTAREGVDANGNTCWIVSFVPAVAGEHLVKTHAEKDGRTLRHREILGVDPW